jgi:3-phenylpropionate/cinnamic acid dioxygenase small subunit
MGVTDNDKVEVRELLVRYASIVDARRFGDLDSVFERDAIFGIDPRVVGLHAIADHLATLLRRCGPTQHLLGNEEIALGGDVAEVRCQVRAIHVGTGAASQLVYEMIGEYRDRAVRTDAGWRIQHRILQPRIRLGDRDRVLGLVSPG